MFPGVRPGAIGGKVTRSIPGSGPSNSQSTADLLPAVSWPGEALGEARR